MDLDVNTIMSYLNSAKKLSEAQAKDRTSNENDLNVDIIKTIDNVDEILIALNSIKSELCRLPLSFCEREYVENYVNPILMVLFFLAFVSYEQSLTVSILTFSPIVPPKKSKLHNSLDLVYRINDECESLFKVLKNRLKPLIQVNST